MQEEIQLLILKLQRGVRLYTLSFIAFICTAIILNITLSPEFSIPATMITSVLVIIFPSINAWSLLMNTELIFKKTHMKEIEEYKKYNSLAGLSGNYVLIL